VDKTFILEAGFERLSGVSFTKGCYVGQEVTARMRHKTELQKGFVKVRISGSITGSTMEITSEKKIVGSLFTIHEDYALAYLKFNYISKSLRVGEAKIEFVAKF
jgi:folate-binding protein YgfZ